MSLRIVRLAGIDVHAHWSLLFVVALVTLSLALGVLPAWHPDWRAPLVWCAALVATAALLASVLAHELAHALVGRRYGACIAHITLFLFGGMAHVAREPATWRGELAMAAAGPLASLLLGVLFFVAAERLAQPGSDAQVSMLAQLGALPTVLLWLAQANIVLALFNLVPAFPLDGGRMLRALLWAASGSLRTATRAAALLGQGFAGLLAATGLAMLLGIQLPLLGAGPSGLWFLGLGWFLHGAARESCRQLGQQEARERAQQVFP